jgi:hypothetical protein
MGKGGAALGFAEIILPVQAEHPGDEGKAYGDAQQCRAGGKAEAAGIVVAELQAKEWAKQ